MGTVSRHFPVCAISIHERSALLHPMRQFDKPLIADRQRRRGVGMCQQFVELMAGVARRAPFAPVRTERIKHLSGNE
jgi:hypothetical protein